MSDNSDCSIPSELTLPQATPDQIDQIDRLNAALNKAGACVTKEREIQKEVGMRTMKGM